MRNSDGGGSGLYGASRGDRPHLGLDFLSIPGQNIYSPATGKAFYFQSSSDKNIWGAIRIIPSNTLRVNHIDVCYINIPDNYDLHTSFNVEIGQVIGTAMNLSDVYPKAMNRGMANHVHLQMNARVFGVGDRWVNPYIFFYFLSPWNRPYFYHHP